MIPLLHLGMIAVGVSYSEQRLSALKVGGWSPHRASSVSGPSLDTPPTENDLEIAKTLGRRLPK